MTESVIGPMISAPTRVPVVGMFVTARTLRLARDTVRRPDHMSFIKQLGLLILLAALAGGGYVGWQKYAAGDASVQKKTGKSRDGRGAPSVETARADFREIDTRLLRHALSFTPREPAWLCRFRSPFSGPRY